MNITGLQVIKRNPTTVFGAEVGEKVQLNIGDTLRVHVGFNYRGREQNVTLHGAIGSRSFLLGFDEYSVGKAALRLPESPDDFSPVEGSVDIEVGAISAGTDYDLYCKIEEFPEAGMPQVDDVIEILEAFELVQETIYHWAYTFEGDAEVCTFDFKLTPEQVPLTEWLGNLIVNSFVSELEKEGQRLLELRVWRDTTPLLWTNYRVEATATAVIPEGVAGIAHPIAWTPIIIGILAILFIVAIYFTIRAIDEVFFKRKGLDEETKAKFDRETLIAMILDLEPDIPPETLEEKEDQELRDQLNEKLAELAPPISWVPLAVIGGLGVLGLGAAAALAFRPKVTEGV